LKIDFGVHYLRNFVFEFPVNYNWSGGQLYSLGERVEYNRYEHMENWMDRVHRLWKMEDE